ncbi:MAG: hypothetical protein COB36_02710 [Alphaproteobacteria bacterium]|nr:MAG: hypothetical protein COB36_02710 [Alphaproteobacteria bacterium]
MEVMLPIKRILTVVTTLFNVSIKIILVIVLAAVVFQLVSEEKIRDECPSTYKNGYRYIEFIDRKLGIPDGLVRTCYAREPHGFLNSDAASITIDAKLPNFTPFSDKLFGIKGNHIKVKFRGAKDLSGSIPLSKDEDIQRRNRDFTIKMSRLNQDKHPIYSKQSESVYGLVKYQSDKTIPRWSGDIYAKFDDEGSIEFYLDCIEEGHKPRRRGCRSSSRYLYDGVDYTYYYDFQHIKDAIKIDNRLQEIIKIE